MLSVFLASIAVAASRFKVPPVMPILMADLEASMVAGGWLMSIFSVTIIIMAIPAALLLERLGPKVTGLFALGCSLAGSIGGALAPSVATLMAARTIEGMGLAVMAVVAPSVISQWFKPEVRGLPMGIWTTWVPLGSVIMFNVARPLETAFHWRTIWWFGALLTLIAAVIYALVVTTPPRSEPEATASSPSPSSDALPRLFNRSLGLIALAFSLFAFAILGYNTWAPSYLSATLGIDVGAANLYASLMFMAAIPANVLAGWLLDRVRKRALLLSTSFFITSVLLFWSFRLESLSVVAPYMIVLGFISNLLPPAFFTLAPETMRTSMVPETMDRADSATLGSGRGGVKEPALASLALAAVLAGSNVGALSGPPILGALLGAGPWTWGSTCLVVVAILGTVATVIAGLRIGPRDRDGGDSSPT
jgi:MFS family permease